MGNGTARGGRLPCKQDIQMGSNPMFSTKGMIPDTSLARKVRRQKMSRK